MQPARTILRVGLAGAVAAALLTGGMAPANAQRAPTPTPAPTPAPQPRVFDPRLRPPDELDRRWQFDAARQLEDQASLLGAYRRTLTFAECAQRVSPARIANLLDQPLASPGERRAANSLIRFAPGCLGDSVIVSTRLLRGAAAEAVLKGFRLADPKRAKAINSERMQDFFDAAPDAEGEKDQTAVALTRLTQCQVLFAPGLARQVLEAEPETAAAERARTQLAEVTAMCGKVEAKSDLAWLVHRSYLAEALYHWTRSSGDSSRS